MPPPQTFAAAAMARRKPPDKGPGAPGSVPIMSERVNAFVVAMPTGVTVDQARKAFIEQYPQFKTFIFFEDRGTVQLQIDPAVAAEQLEALAAGELKVGDVAVKFERLYHARGTLNFLEGVISPFLWSPATVEGLATALAPFGKLLRKVPGRHSDGTLNGNVHIALDMSAALQAPPTSFAIEHDGHAQAVHFRVTNRFQSKFCAYCRATTHERPECQKAPPCLKCGARSHRVKDCRARATAPSPQPQAVAKGPVPGAAPAKSPPTGSRNAKRARFDDAANASGPSFTFHLPAAAAAAASASSGPSKHAPPPPAAQASLSPPASPAAPAAAAAARPSGPQAPPPPQASSPQTASSQDPSQKSSSQDSSQEPSPQASAAAASALSSSSSPSGNRRSLRKTKSAPSVSESSSADPGGEDADMTDA
ncbi:hypothetical protein ACM66B_001403 [Microbotryomycetes sp. NB124-2]